MYTHLYYHFFRAVFYRAFWRLTQRKYTKLDRSTGGQNMHWKLESSLIIVKKKNNRRRCQSINDRQYTTKIFPPYFNYLLEILTQLLHTCNTRLWVCVCEWVLVWVLHLVSYSTKWLCGLLWSRADIAVAFDLLTCAAGPTHTYTRPSL